jgi:glycosyltransferase involved in cell wall biosynthesis
MTSAMHIQTSSYRPTYLFVLSSSCQMYSGTGKLIFDYILYCKDDFAFSILIDSENKINVEITAAFCANHDVPLHISLPLNLPGCPDSGVRSIPLHLNKHDYDFIECISWANASTNLSVLSALPAQSKLIFTPLSQPLWTLPGHNRFFMVSMVFSRMLRSADTVFTIAPSESTLAEFEGATAKIHCVPLGVDTREFHNLDCHDPYRVLCVCDCREPRKRVDLLLAAFAAAFQMEPRLRLVLAGRDSDSLEIPAVIKPVVTRLGYITQEELVRLYQIAGQFVLLSDYEAFGYPIAEALCCGTPVLVNRMPAQEELFADLPGVNWTRNTDAPMTADGIVALASHKYNYSEISAAASARFDFEHTCGKRRQVLLEH